MSDSINIKPHTYLITFQGKLDKSWQTWFSGLRVSTDQDIQGNTVTSLDGHIVDQAALRGILNKLWDLNLSLISVTHLKTDLDLENNHEN
jgi:hypothetical protein